MNAGESQLAIGSLVVCANHTMAASIAIKPAISNSEIVPAMIFALGLSFHDPPPRLVLIIFLQSPARYRSQPYESGGFCFCPVWVAVVNLKAPYKAPIVIRTLTL